ncbi:hypothetical protein SSSV4_ORF49 [Sulfolobus spindle-shaped virus 4]|uniref:Uncharacterized protein n=2 Tax=Alphafusellovirus TaxID=10475 RepID=A8TKJ4_9VIRU|nr:hypothetical protein SSSV4_ORF49 [Sulfolobus spindle-shaped virus 4]YP_002221490.1 hypothetical protein SSSV5_gp25 [Sulfolobus spindle-shaped virus 5]ABV26212.1 hypothetical protein [Sulfolobus spindle-shaped virus 4]ABV26246.1 hypothetical protein [Sulfolobus spindle-shaped virus 5]
MSKELRYIKQKLDELLSECICDDPESMRELEEMMKMIEHALEYCQVGDW